MKQQEKILEQLHQAEQRLATWEWTRDNADQNILAASAIINDLRVKLDELKGV